MKMIISLDNLLSKMFKYDKGERVQHGLKGITQVSYNGQVYRVTPATLTERTEAMVKASIEPQLYLPWGTILDDWITLRRGEDITVVILSDEGCQTMLVPVIEENL